MVIEIMNVVLMNMVMSNYITVDERERTQCEDNKVFTRTNNVRLRKRNL